MGTDGEKKPTTGMGQDRVKYMDDPVNAFPAGAITDYRLRVAQQLLTNGTLVLGVWEAQGGALRHVLDGSELVPVRDPAEIALDMAEDLVRLAEARGYIKPMPETSELPGAVKKQAERLAKFHVHQQITANREGMLAAASSPAVAVHQ